MLTSVRTKRFKNAEAKLPDHVKEQAKKAFHLWNENNHHPGLHYKNIVPGKPIFSVRVALGYRAVGLLEEGKMIWFWIGSHADYEELIKLL
jgi:hypothetical protein